MGKHDEQSHYLHTPKALKFKQPRPQATYVQPTPKNMRLGALNRRG